jgi:hypothetical protein
MLLHEKVSRAKTTDGIVFQNYYKQTAHYDWKDSTAEYVKAKLFDKKPTVHD